MRGYHDEMGGPDSIAQPSEWGSLGFGDGVTAAGLPASPGLEPAPQNVETRAQIVAVKLKAQSALLSDSPSEDTLRHNFLLRRQLTDPGYGAVHELSWREKVANGLGVPYVAEQCDCRDCLSSPLPSE